MLNNLTHCSSGVLHLFFFFFVYSNNNKFFENFSLVGINIRMKLINYTLCVWKPKTRELLNNPQPPRQRKKTKCAKLHSKNDCTWLCIMYYTLKYETNLCVSNQKFENTHSPNDKYANDRLRDDRDTKKKKQHITSQFSYDDIQIFK